MKDFLKGSIFTFPRLQMPAVSSVLFIKLVQLSSEFMRSLSFSLFSQTEAKCLLRGSDPLQLWAGFHQPPPLLLRPLEP